MSKDTHDFIKKWFEEIDQQNQAAMADLEQQATMLNAIRREHPSVGNIQELLQLNAAAHDRLRNLHHVDESRFEELRSKHGHGFWCRLKHALGKKHNDRH